MQFLPSKRGSTPSIAEKISQAARAVEERGVKTIRLNLGQPLTGAPAGAREALAEAMNGRPLGYSPAAGIPELRERIACHYREQYGVSVGADRIIVTIGASGGLIVSLIANFDVGARIALPLPSFGGYRHIIETLGMEVVDFSCATENHYQPVVADLERLGELDGLLITSPGNPTGSMIAPQQLQQVVEYCLANRIRLISDEIYHGIVFTEEIPQQTALAYSPELIVMNSFSKYYSMAGWRIGWIVIPEEMESAVQNLARNMFIAPPTASQYAALAALDCRPELDGHVERYARNRAILLNGLPAAGFDRFPPLDGGFYVYAHVKHLHHDSIEFCLEMLEATGVVASPGADYDPLRGAHYVRFSYAGATEDIEEAVERLQKWRRE